MNETDRESLYLRAYNTWGKDSQLLMLFEEMAELQKAICKSQRGQNNIDEIIDEMADVRIMLQQLQTIFMIPETTIVNREEVKLERLNKTVKTHEDLK